MTHKEKALTYLSQKYHCSQAILAAYCEEPGITEGQAFKVAYCFNSGMRKGEVCGVCAGALMVLGLKHSAAPEETAASRAKADSAAAAFLEAFQKKNGSYLCNKLLGVRHLLTGGGSPCRGA